MVGTVIGITFGVSRKSVNPKEILCKGKYTYSFYKGSFDGVAGQLVIFKSF